MISRFEWVLAAVLLEPACPIWGVVDENEGQPAVADDTPERPSSPAGERPRAEGPETRYEDAPGELDTDPALAAKAKVVWDTRCARCHGAYGQGKKPGEAGFDPPPKDFRDPKWQAATPDEHIKKVILQGGLPTGKSPAMPANLDLRNDPALLDELVRILRGLPHWKTADQADDSSG